MSEKKTKKKYEKPQLTTIDLAADEVLAGNCKSVGVPGARQPNSCNFHRVCYQRGS